MKYFISFSYDGSKYNGLQRLKNENTVQGELEKVLSKLDMNFVHVRCAGRTDKGVHAQDQKAHFILKRELTPFRLRYYINRMTSKYLYVKDCRVLTDNNFHARFSVKEKEYTYKINIGEYDPIMENYVYNLNKDLDIKKMIEAINLFKGIKNYKAFTTSDHSNFFCKINEINIEKKDYMIIISFRGKSFLTHMVRNIVSILILVGIGKIKTDDIKEMLKMGEKTFEYAPAPASGLYLTKVYY